MAKGGGDGDSLRGGAPVDEAAFGLARIGQIAVPVSDIELAIAFYRDGH
jgi:hypothetical protein